MDINAILTKAMDTVQALLSDTEKLESLFDKAAEEAKNIPKVGDQVSKAAVLAELIIFYINGQYTTIPKRSIGAAVLAYLYYVSPIDLIPDSIPLIGKVDDAMIAALCWGMIDGDLKLFKEWKQAREIPTVD